MSVSCAVLLDRDGTLIEDKHYLSEPSGVALLPGVGPALSRLVQAGHRLFLVSNQSGVGRGYFTEQAVVACQKRLEELLEPYGVAFTDAVWCPHAPEESCFCRKPLPGMFDELRDRHGLRNCELRPVLKQRSGGCGGRNAVLCATIESSGIVTSTGVF